jgi:penicillin-insensitive murein DD-endopeptidase
VRAPLLGLALVLAAPVVVYAQDAATPASTSVGGPSSGTLLAGVKLPERGEGYYFNPKRPPEAAYGTAELVQAIVQAAAVVERELPGSSLTVNDLSLPAGGPIRQHGSHQSGRDADILFYVLDALDPKGAPIPSVGVPLDPKGLGWDFKALPDPKDDQRVKLDAPRTWRFMHALIDATGDQLQRIFLAEHLRTLLLAQAEKARAPKAVRDRFAAVTCQPSAPHDDHMHVRLFCAPEDIAAGCEDSPPGYPWRTQALAALGITPKIASAYTSKVEREAKAERTTTPDEARKRAGPMHAKVIQFLNQRRAWLQQPHPGRPFCK